MTDDSGPVIMAMQKGEGGKFIFADFTHDAWHDLTDSHCEAGDTACGWLAGERVSTIHRRFRWTR